MVGWHYRFNGHEFEQTLGDGERGKPGVLQSMGLQGAGHDLATEQVGDSALLLCVSSKKKGHHLT